MEPFLKKAKVHDEQTTGDQVEDAFKPLFKYYKGKNPPPCLDEAIDLSNSLPSCSTTCQHAVVQLQPSMVSSTDTCRSVGLRPSSSWEIFKFENIEGFTFIKNPFIRVGQRKWVERCLRDFTGPENPSNLAAHFSPSLLTDVWNGGLGVSDKKSLLYKLRWVTLGYHHDWNTKVYSSDHIGTLPSDLGALSSCIAETIGVTSYRAEAAIINYYHPDSTLAAHTDHSEPDRKAPLISISFGLPAVFLLGGETKAVKPEAIVIRSGDVVVMSGACRLAYHAVPKILQIPEKDLKPYFYDPVPEAEKGRLSEPGAQANVCDEAGVPQHCTETRSVCPTSCTCAGKQGSDCGAKDKSVCLCGSSVQTAEGAKSDFAEYWEYIKQNRINLNIRQVLPPGCKSLEDT